MSITHKNLLDSINLKVELIGENRPNRPGDTIQVRRLTIHNTDNTDAGADAKAHSSFVRNTGYYLLNGKKNWVSWHYTVDDHQAIRHLPDKERAYHAGSSANASSIAIEICMNKGIDQAAANDRAAKLAALVLSTHDLSINDMVTHKSWTGKECPSLLVAAAKWEGFRKMVGGYLNSVSETVELTESVAGSDGAFQFKACQCGAESEHIT